MPKKKRDKSPPDPKDPRNYFNAWTSNYDPIEDGYITHAFFDGPGGERSLCGRKMAEGGGLNLGRNKGSYGFSDDFWTPGCRQCSRILIKRGLMTENHEVPANA